MESTEDEEHMEDPMINTILIFDLEMINKSMSKNCRSTSFGIQKFENDLSRVLVESAIVFI
jgi:hypothetical protein